MTEKEIERMLLPRYEVIADYPGSPYNLWQILSEDSFELPSDFIEFDFDKYPHLFRRLEWWEKRELSEMPKYVKSCYYNKIQFVHEVKEWVGYNHSGQPLYRFLNRSGQMTTFCAWEMLPATEAEYEKGGVNENR